MLKSFEALKVRLTSCKFNQEFLHNGGQGLITFRGPDSCAMVKFLVDGYCDIFHTHSITVLLVSVKHGKQQLLIAKPRYTE